MAIPLCLRIHVVIGFYGLLLVCFLSCLFYVLSLGNWLGKRKVDGNWERFVVTNR